MIHMRYMMGGRLPRQDHSQKIRHNTSERQSDIQAKGDATVSPPTSHQETRKKQQAHQRLFQATTPKSHLWCVLSQLTRTSSMTKT